MLSTTSVHHAEKNDPIRTLFDDPLELTAWAKGSVRGSRAVAGITS
jgi:hypothetical protein